MKYLTSFIMFVLVGILFAAPTSNDEDGAKIIIKKSVYSNDIVIYKGNHEIVNLLVPQNSLNYDENESSSTESNEVDADTTFFFAEADIQPDGSRVDQGLYVFKEGKATKILEHGRDAAASGDNSKLVFFGAKDGLYIYNPNTNSADKYGSITDSIIGIATEVEGDVIYILTEDREVYKVTNNGQTKEKLKAIVKAQQIVLDNSNNLYFYSDDKVPYVYTTTGVKKIEGLREGYSSVYLIKPMYVMEDSVPFLVDKKVYALYANGTSKLSDFEIETDARPTAYAPEGTYTQYYAYGKKIYEYDLLKLLLNIVKGIGSFLKEKAISDIGARAAKPKGQALRAKA